MPTSINASFDQFTVLQNALSELNYAQPLIRESVPLVYAIFTDLVEVTKKYTQLRKQSQGTEQQLKSQIQPIKVENDNLTKSNNTLHLKIIQNNDQFQEEIKKIQSQYDALKLEKNEINVLLNQKKHKIKNQEIMINNLKKKMNAIISSKTTNHKQLIGKTAKISFNSHLLSPASTKNGNNTEDTSNHNHKYALLENENDSLLLQITQLTKTNHGHKERIMDLENKLKTRNHELNRINDNVMIDDNRIKLIQYKQEKEDETERIKHLESQIEVLQNEVMEKENDMCDNDVKDEIIHKLKKENKSLNEKLEITWNEMDKLKVDLSAIKQSSSALKLEKKYDILKSTKKLSTNVSEITRLHNKIEELNKLNKVLERKLEHKHKQHSILSDRNKEESSSNHTLNVRLEMKEKEIDKLRMEHVAFIKETDDLKHKIAACSHEMEMNRNNGNNKEIQLKSTENKLQILRKDSMNLSTKYQELKTLNKKNQELNQEMKRKNDEYSFKIKCLEKENVSMDERMMILMEKKSDCEKLENKKETEKFELVKKLQNMEFKNSDLEKEKQWNNTALMQYQNKMGKLEKEKKGLSVNIERINAAFEAEKLKYNEMEYRYNSLLKHSDGMDGKLKQSENMIMSLKSLKAEFDVNTENKNALELEMIEIKNENERLHKDNKRMEKNNKRKEDVIQKIDEEKNALKLILQQMQQRLSAFQQRLGLITKDRDDIKQIYDEVHIEMDHKNELISNLNMNLNDLKTEYTKLQHSLKDLSKKYDELQDEYSNKEHLAKTSMNKIKEFNQMQDKLTANLRHEFEDKNVLKHNLREMKQHRDAVMAKYDELKKECNDLKDMKIPNMRQEIITLQLKNGELKVLCNKLDDGHKTAQIKIEELYSQNTELNHCTNEKQRKYEEVHHQLAESYKDKENMKMALDRLVTEHDKLQNELDKTAEIIEMLNKNINDEKYKNSEFQSILSETQQKYRQQQKQLMEYASSLRLNDETMKKMEKEVLPRLVEANRLKAEQLKQSQNDIHAITKENQFLNNEYAVTINDRDSKNNQLSSVLNKMLYLESQMKNIQSEKKQILDNYKCVVLENEKLQKISQILDKNKSEFNMKISVLEQHIARRDHRIKHLERNLTEANMGNHELQRQNQSITRDLECVNLNNSKNQTMSHNLQKDLDCLQHGVVQKQLMDLQKKNKIIIEFKKENDKLQNVINELNVEKEVALNSLNGAQQKMGKLQNIIKTLRINSVSNNEVVMKEKDESTKMKLELNQMKDLNDRLNVQLQKIQTS